ncbi:hypothetical protein [Sphingomonas sp.]|jgi:hypothetical protein|uniref:hypothetical protein n=1 Tax=Sphingomonas sp. TaxID=28214 RepID=UPI002EDBAC87
MTRPISIVRFDYCYLGALVVGAVNAALNWQRYTAMPAVRDAQVMFGAWYLPTVTAIGYLIPLLLWYFVARRGSVVAKWIVVVLFGLGMVGLLIALAMGTMASGLGGVLSVVAIVLNAVAVWLLFRPDARAWFGEKAHDDRDAA